MREKKEKKQEEQDEEEEEWQTVNRQKTAGPVRGEGRERREGKREIA